MSKSERSLRTPFSSLSSILVSMCCGPAKNRKQKNKEKDTETTGVNTQKQDQTTLQRTALSQKPDLITGNNDDPPSSDNTLKDVPGKMPEVELEGGKTKDLYFTDEQLV